MDKVDISGLDARLLRLFLAVYDRSSISRAADDLDLNQSTVSHGIERLRAILDDPLFVRVGRGIAPSDVATRLEPTMRRILHDMEALVLRDPYCPEEDRNPVTIACNVTELLPQLGALRGLLAELAPRAPLRFLDLGARTNTEALLAAGQADVVITVRLPGYPASIMHEGWLRDRQVVFYDSACRGPVRTVQDFAEARHAALDFGGGKASMLSLALERHGLQRTVMLNTANVYALGALIRGTDMITTMQSRFQSTALQGFNTCPVPFPMQEVIYDMVWHRRRHASPRLQWLLGIIRAASASDRPPGTA